MAKPTLPASAPLINHDHPKAAQAQRMIDGLADRLVALCLRGELDALNPRHEHCDSVVVYEVAEELISQHNLGPVEYAVALVLVYLATVEHETMATAGGSDCDDAIISMGDHCLAVLAVSQAERVIDRALNYSFA